MIVLSVRVTLFDSLEARVGGVLAGDLGGRRVEGGRLLQVALQGVACDDGRYRETLS